MRSGGPLGFWPVAAWSRGGWKLYYSGGTPKSFWLQPWSPALGATLVRRSLFGSCRRPDAAVEMSHLRGVKACVLLWAMLGFLACGAFGGPRHGGQPPLAVPSPALAQQESRPDGQEQLAAAGAVAPAWCSEPSAWATGEHSTARLAELVKTVESLRGALTALGKAPAYPGLGATRQGHET